MTGYFRSFRSFTLAVFALPLLLVALPARARAANIVVDTTAGGHALFFCTLEDAVKSFNNEASPGGSGCTAGTGHDEIDFAVTGLITLVNPLVVNNTIESHPFLRIEGSPGGPYGAGGGIQLTGSNALQIMIVQANNNIAIHSLTFENGFVESDTHGGGAISMRGGEMFINSCTFQNNEALGATATNGSGAGGAVALESDYEEVVFRNSTFYKNKAVSQSGGTSYGGGVNSSPAHNFIKIVDCSFDANVANKGGGVSSHSGVEFQSSLLKNIGYTSNPNCFFPTNPSTDDGYDIESAANCGFTGTGSLQNTDPDFVAGGPTNNGGPTPTIRLSEFGPTSPAIDFDLFCPEDHDQRGYGRPDPEDFYNLPPVPCDSGAFETGAVAPIVLNSQKVQIVGVGNSLNINLLLDITDNPTGLDDYGNPNCKSDNDLLNSGLELELVNGTCADMVDEFLGVFLDLSPFSTHQVGNTEYGVLTQLLNAGTEHVSARMNTLTKPFGACGRWLLNVQITGVSPFEIIAPPFPYSLLMSDSDGENIQCFDLNNPKPIIGGKPPKGTLPTL